jgi:hypothetical protein
MSFKATAFQVMIASPSDVVRERQVATDVLHEWNIINSRKTRIVLLPAGWETHAIPLMGDRPQEIINKYVLQHSDLLVAIFWTRIGTSTGEAISGTVEEIETHMKAGKPALLYFCSAAVRLDDAAQLQYDALQEFKKHWRDRGLMQEFADPTEFQHKFMHQVSLTINDHPYFAQIKEARADNEHSRQDTQLRLTTDAQDLLLAAANDRNGIVMRLRFLQGTSITANGRDFNEVGDARSTARWESALDELVHDDCLRDKGHKGEVFGVTNHGYEVADVIRAGAE